MKSCSMSPPYFKLLLAAGHLYARVVSTDPIPGESLAFIFDNNKFGTGLPHDSPEHSCSTTLHRRIEKQHCVLSNVCWSSEERSASSRRNSVHLKRVSNWPHAVTHNCFPYPKGRDCDGFPLPTVHTLPTIEARFTHELLNVHELDVCCKKSRISSPDADSYRTDRTIVVVSAAHAALSNLYHLFAIVIVPYVNILWEQDFLMQPAELVIDVDAVHVDMLQPSFLEFLGLFFKRVHVAPQRTVCSSTIVLGLLQEDYLYVHSHRRALAPAGPSDHRWAPVRRHILQAAGIFENGVHKPQVVRKRRPVVLIENRLHTRKITNLDKTIDLFTRRGYHVLRVHNGTAYPSVADTMRLIHEADIVLAAHGAFHTLGLALRPRALMIEILPPNFEKTNWVHSITYHNWSFLFNYRHVALRSDVTGGSSPTDEWADGRNLDVSVHVRDLDALLSRFASV